MRRQRCTFLVQLNSYSYAMACTSINGLEFGAEEKNHIFKFMQIQEETTTKLRQNSWRKYKPIMLTGYEKDIFIKHQAFCFFFCTVV